MTEKKTRMKASERREQILDIARSCFTEYGFIGTTTAMIAERAEVSEPILYRHFSSKLELFHAVLTETLDIALKRFDEVARGKKNGADKLLAIVEDYPDFSRRQRNLMNVVDRAVAPDQTERTKKYLRDYFSGFESVLLGFVREGQADGSIRRTLDASTLASFLTMAGTGFGVLDALDFDSATSKSFPEDTKKLLAALLRK